jgi:hypothetical protein
MATVNGVAPAHGSGVEESTIDGVRLVLMVGSGRYEVRAANPSR